MFPNNADPNSIKSAYRKMAMKYHPDKNPGDKNAEKKFKEASEAYNILSDQEKRQAYDTYGHDAFNQTGGGGFSEGFRVLGIFLTSLKIFWRLRRERLTAKATTERSGSKI